MVKWLNTLPNAQTLQMNGRRSQHLIRLLAPRRRAWNADTLDPRVCVEHTIFHRSRADHHASRKSKLTQHRTLRDAAVETRHPPPIIRQPAQAVEPPKHTMRQAHGPLGVGRACPMCTDVGLDQQLRQLPANAAGGCLNWADRETPTSGSCQPRLTPRRPPEPGANGGACARFARAIPRRPTVGTSRCPP